ncbi:MAG: thioredoxin family protein [Jiangellaceae bacterium]
MDVTLLYFDDCPHWRLVDRRLHALAADLDVRVSYQVVSTPDDAEALVFHGSPTILIDGRDPFAHADQPIGLACRIYQTPSGPAGAPTIQQLRSALNLTRDER